MIKREDRKKKETIKRTMIKGISHLGKTAKKKEERVVREEEE